jgi:hypothetical protein
MEGGKIMKENYTITLSRDKINVLKTYINNLRVVQTDFDEDQFLFVVENIIEQVSKQKYVALLNKLTQY